MPTCRFVVVALAGVATLAGIAARPAAAETTPLGPGASVCPGAVGAAGDVAVLNLTPVQATAGGFGALRRSDAPSNNSLGEQAVSNVNFRAGSVDPNVALATIGADGRVCFDNSPHATIHLVADQMGVMPAAAYESAAATGAKRLVDTRRSYVEGGPAVLSVSPGASVCPQAVGAPGRVAVLNITPLNASGGGFAAVRASDAPSNNSLGESAVSNVNFRIGSVDPNLAFAKVGSDGRICIDNSPHATIQLIVDQMGSLPADAFVPAAASGATRLIDTRRGLVVGGVAAGAVAPGAAVCAKAVGQPGDIAVVNGTPVAAGGPGFMAVRASNAPSNNTLGDNAVSNWNFAVATVDPNVAFATIGPDGSICVDNSPHATVEMVLDQAGYIPAGWFTPATTTGAARLVDTRRGFVAVPGTLPPPPPPPATTTPSGVTTPGAPTGLSATAGPGTVALAWNPPASDGGAVIDQYLVERAPASTGPWSVVKLTTATSHLDTHLTPLDRWYRVTARNSAGWGSPSGPAKGRAEQPLAPGAVRELSAKSDDSRVTLSWLPPDGDGGAPVTNYTIAFRFECDPSKPLIVSAHVVGTTHTDTGLTEGIGYCYTVAAVNSAGTGAGSVVEVRVGRPTKPEPCPLQAWSFPEQDGSVEWSLQVSWSTPHDDGGSPITEYVVTWRSGLSNITTENLPATARTAWLDQVDAGKSYHAFVRALTAKGSGVSCYTGLVTPG